MILFINACVRRNSRTKRLAEYLLSAWNEKVTEIRPVELKLPPVDEDYLQTRDELVGRQDFQHPMFQLACQFASADSIVIAAPYWDFSFPAALKQYFEQISVPGITFEYTQSGYPRGLCKAKRLYYVTTSGGAGVPEEYGFGYVQALAKNLYGIPEVRLILAEGLDLDGADPDAILKDCISFLY